MSELAKSKKQLDAYNKGLKAGREAANRFSDEELRTAIKSKYDAFQYVRNYDIQCQLEGQIEGFEQILLERAEPQMKAQNLEMNAEIAETSIKDEQQVWECIRKLD